MSDLFTLARDRAHAFRDRVLDTVKRFRTSYGDAPVRVYLTDADAFIFRWACVDAGIFGDMPYGLEVSTDRRDLCAGDMILMRDYPDGWTRSMYRGAHE